MAVEIWGPASGSSRVVIDRDAHNRVRLRASTDFGEANCGFTDEQARRIRDGLNEILGEKSKTEQFARALENEDFANVADALGARMCCDGQMCGCRGSSVGDYLAHELRASFG